MTGPTIWDVLNNTLQPHHIIYFHIDLLLFKPTLKEVEGIRDRVGHDLLSIVLMEDGWPTMHDCLHKGLEMATTKYVLFHKNNNLGAQKGWLTKLVTTMEYAEPRPILLSPAVNVVHRRGKVEDHGAAMDITLHDHGLDSPVLVFTSEPSGRSNKSRTVVSPSGEQVHHPLLYLLLCFG
jgi:hypothetical protein